MKIGKICKGAIISMRSLVSDEKEYRSSHFYVIISSRVSNNVPFVQCMTITSLYNKKETIEVPVLMPNGTVSFICPYNIFSFPVSEIQSRQIQGYVTDNEYYSMEEFISFLTDIYIAFHKMGSKMEIEKEVFKYKSFFRNKFSGAQEYRNTNEKKEKMNRSERSDLNGSIGENKPRKKSRKQKKREKMVRKRDELKRRDIIESIEEMSENQINHLSMETLTESLSVANLENHRKESTPEELLEFFSRSSPSWTISEISEYLRELDLNGPKFLSEKYGVPVKKVYKKNYALKRAAKRFGILD